MYGHFVPQVYQKSWHTKNGERNVFYFDKDDLSKPKNKQGGNIEKNLGEENLYIIDSTDTINGVSATGEQIEKSFDKYIEDKWNNVLQNITMMVSWFNEQGNAIVGVKKDDISTSLSNDLVAFIVMQYFRIKKNFEKADNGIVRLILELCKEEYSRKTGIDPSQIPDLQNDAKYYNSIWKSILFDCFVGKDSVLDLVSQKIIDNYSFVVFSTDESIPTFILADNPVIWNTYENKPYELLESGIFMPINPNILIGILNFGKNCNVCIGDYIFIDANINFSKYINYVLLDQSDHTIGFCEDSLKDKISANFNKLCDWDTMFTDK